MNKKKKTRMTQNDIKTAKRLLKYVTEKYKLQFILVFICILISAVATTAVSLSLRYLLDDFILPLIGQKTPDFEGLYKALAVLGCIFFAGVVACAKSIISETGIAFDVPVAFMSGLSMSVKTFAASGADTAQKNAGVSDSVLTNVCVGGVAIVNTAVYEPSAMLLAIVDKVVASPDAHW